MHFKISHSCYSALQTNMLFGLVSSSIIMAGLLYVLVTDQMLQCVFCSACQLSFATISNPSCRLLPWLEHCAVIVHCAEGTGMLNLTFQLSFKLPCI